MIFTNTIDEAQLHDLRQLVAPLLIDVQLQGNDVSDGLLRLGCTAGPNASLENAFHELSHFIEIDQARMCSKDWGLRHGKWEPNPFITHWNSPKGWHLKTTDKHVQRELRVWTMQYVLMTSRNLVVSPKELVSSATYLPDFELFLPGSTDKQRVIELEKRVIELASTPQYSVESLCAEPSRRKVIVARRGRHFALKALAGRESSAPRELVLGYSFDSGLEIGFGRRCKLGPCTGS